MKKCHELIEGYDEVIERLGGNAELFERLLHKFRDTYSETHGELEEFLATGKFEDAFRLVHTIKGVSANLGLGELWRASIVLEAKMRANKYDHIESECEVFFIALDKAIATI